MSIDDARIIYFDTDCTMQHNPTACIEYTENYENCDDFRINSINKTTLVQHYVLELVTYK